VQTGVKANQTAAAAPEGTPDAGVKSDPKPDREAAFKKLITGEYKDLFDAHVQGIVKNRLKGPIEDAKRYRALRPTLDLMAERYGIKDKSDVDAIIKAIDADDEIIARMAMERNQTEEEFRRDWKNQVQTIQLQEEIESLHREIDDRRKQEEADRIYQRWNQQAESAKAFYPSLNLDVELQNEQFRALIRNPAISVQTAYEVIHKDEITAGLLRHATEHAAQKVAASVAANGARPAENGMGSQGAASVKLDPTKMTKAQRRELNLRASRGEKIFF
jgi:hypothetical protein